MAAPGGAEYIEVRRASSPANSIPGHRSVAEFCRPMKNASIEEFVFPATRDA